MEEPYTTISFRRSLFCIICLTLSAGLADSKTLNCRRDPHATVDMPISLAAGRLVQTPEFAVKHKRYLIEIKAQRVVASEELACKMGFILNSLDDSCKVEPVIESNWRVLDGDRVVANGRADGKSTDFESDACYMGRFIGDFQGESKRKYVLEVTFTKDGTVLDANHPHLVVLMDTGLSM